MLRRAKTLLLSNNLIFRLSDDIKDSLPAVHTLMMANNLLRNLTDLRPLVHLPVLKRLCLIDNNVTKQPNYRAYVINLLPNLLVLDFKKVRPKVRGPELLRSAVRPCAPARCPAVPHALWRKQ